MSSSPARVRPETSGLGRLTMTSRSSKRKSVQERGEMEALEVEGATRDGLVSGGTSSTSMQSMKRRLLDIRPGWGYLV
jgi:hypothetical protein